MFTDREVLLIARMVRAFTASGADVDTMASIKRKAQKHVNNLTSGQLEQLAAAEAQAQADPLKIAFEIKAKAKKLLEEKRAAGELEVEAEDHTEKVEVQA